MKVYEIIPGSLYQRGRFDKWPEDKISEALHNLKIGEVATLIRRPVFIPKDIGHWYMPIPDGRIQNEVKLLGLAEHLLQRILEGRKVLIHCNAGRNRSGLISALIVRRYFKISGREALQYVRERRPRAVANPHFEKYLEGLL